MKCPLSWKDGWVWAAQTRRACSRQRGKHSKGPEERQKMAHSVTSSTSTWLEGKVQEEKCQELKLKKFKKKRGGIRAYMIFYANTHLNFIIRMMVSFRRVLIRTWEMTQCLLCNALLYSRAWRKESGKNQEGIWGSDQRANDKNLDSDTEYEQKWIIMREE